MKIVAAERDEFQRSLDTALRYLSSRPRSEAELRFRLNRRGFDSETISRVLTKLKEQHLVDDVAFARFWRSNREAFSPRSRRLMAQELRSKGVAAEIISQVTAGLDDELQAYEAAQRKLRQAKELAYPDFCQKLGAFLHRRGFNYEIVRHTIDRAWKEVGK
jgi:regulatory protein